MAAICYLPYRVDRSGSWVALVAEQTDHYTAVVHQDSRRGPTSYLPRRDWLAFAASNADAVS